MKTSTLLTGALAPSGLAAIAPKNFIFVIPDGLAPASITLARTYLSLLEGGSPGAPQIKDIALDLPPVGVVRSHSSNNLVTDSAAAGTALASGFKTLNGALGVLPNNQPVATILEAAKHDGYLTALVVTSIINHATPAAYSSHVLNRNDYATIAAQQIGYSHPLKQKVDVLLGGGRCYFKPQGESGSCRSDDIDLFGFAEENGYYIAQNRTQFDELNVGNGTIQLPYVGLFNDGDLSYEADRMLQAEDVQEPSLTELTEAALNSLHRASRNEEKGYFMMVEASRIDHASHANDPVAHIHDVLEYNRVIELLTSWIDEHPDTAMISVADHETGGLTLPGGYDPRPLQKAQHSAEYWGNLWNRYTGNKRDYLVNTVLRSYGVTNPSTQTIDTILNGSFQAELVKAMSRQIGVAWSTGGHTAVDVTLYAYAAGEMGQQLKVDLAGGHDNVELPRYIEEALGVSLDEVTELLRENWGQ